MSITMLLLTIVGLPLGVTSIVFVFKYRNRRQLTYVDQGCLPLFESIVKSLDGIEILYNKKPIDPNLYFLRGSLANTGNVDIDKSSIYEPLCINLPPPYRWLKATVTKSSPGVNVHSEIRHDSTLEFKWDLLKSNEALSFNALIKGCSGKDGNETKTIPELISFSHRITDLPRIMKVKESMSPSSWMPSIAIGIMMGALLGDLIVSYTLPSAKSGNDLMDNFLQLAFLSFGGILFCIWYLKRRRQRKLQQITET